MAASVTAEPDRTTTQNIHYAPAQKTTSTKSERPASPRFDGHRRDSWIVEDYDELTELRARQRTYEGAYVRAAFANLIYALIILKLFSKDFATIGLLWVILAGILLSISLFRRGRDYLDFSDSYIAETGRQVISGLGRPADGGSQQQSQQRAEQASADKPLPPASKRLWSTRPFKTSGRAVLGLTSVVLGAEVTLLVLILRLPP